MKSSFTIPICALILVACCALAQNITVPKEVVSFRDSPYFYQTIRGLKYNIPTPNSENIQTTIHDFDLVYQEYIQELLKGFIAELAGDYVKAQNHYEHCLAISVHEEQSYYTHLDLARISLKLNSFSRTKEHLKIYLSAMKQEINAGEGKLTEIFFGYTPSGEALEEMKAHYKNMTMVYDQLERAF